MNKFSRRGTAFWAKLVVGLLLLIILGGGMLANIFFIGSPAGIAETEVGLMKNNRTGRVDTNNVYPPGKYYTSSFPGTDWGIAGFVMGSPSRDWMTSFITFPTRALEIRFEEVKGAESDISGPGINSNSYDGLAYTTDVYIAFNLNPDDVGILYKEYGEGWKAGVREMARKTVRNVLSTKLGVELYANRTNIQEEVLVELDVNLEMYYCSATVVAIKSMNLPDAFIGALEAKQIAKQAVETAAFRYQETEVEAQILILQAETERNITVLLAEGEADATIIAAEAEARGLQMIYDTRANFSQHIKESLNLTNYELIQYLYVLAIQEHSNALIIVGGDGSGFLLSMNSTGMGLSDIAEEIRTDRPPIWDDYDWDFAPGVEDKTPDSSGEESTSEQEDSSTGSSSDEVSSPFWMLLTWIGVLALLFVRDRRGRKNKD